MPRGVLVRSEGAHHRAGYLPYLLQTTATLEKIMGAGDIYRRFVHVEEKHARRRLFLRVRLSRVQLAHCLFPCGRVASVCQSRTAALVSVWSLAHALSPRAILPHRV